MHSSGCVLQDIQNFFVNMSSIYAILPKNYLCKKCGSVGDHWIMECGVSLWKKLPCIPHKVNSENKAFFDRKSKLFVVLPHIIGDVDVFDRIEEALWKYSFLRNKWERYTIQLTMEQSFDFTPLIIPLLNPVGINSDGNKMYFCSDSNEVVILQLMSDTNVCKLKVIKDLEVKCGISSACLFGSGVMVGDEFHIIYEQHVKYNINTEKFQILGDLPKKRICYGGLINMENKLWLFGGYDYELSAFDTVYEYDIVNNHWKCVAVKLPHAIKFVSCASILNGQMILVFGVSQSDDRTPVERFDHIFIYEVATKIIKKSRIILPEWGSQIFAISDEKKNSILIRCWIEEQWCNFPEDLIKLIFDYYIYEVIHLLSNKNGSHYEIDVFEILNYC